MRLGRILAITGAALVTAFVLFILVCGVALGPRYMARFVFWNLSDIRDYEKFPSHEVLNAPPVFNFNRDLQEQRVRTVFGGAEYKYRGKPAKVGDFEEFLASTGTTAFIVIKNDTILYEGYFNGYSRDSINTSFSVAKSFTSALIGIAIDEGAIGGVDEPITEYLPELKGKGRESVTIRHVLMMSSGLTYHDSPLFGIIEFPWDSNPRNYYFPDLRRIALNVEPGEEPGKHFQYNNDHPLLLGMILERTTQMPAAEYLQEKIWKPLGMEYPASWSVDSEESGFAKMESGINARAIDFAKFGRLFLNKGEWNGNRIISEQWVEESTMRDLTTPPDYYSRPGWCSSFFESGRGYYKYMWWGYSRKDGGCDFLANGHLGQYIYVCPQHNLVIVRNGKRIGRIDSWPKLFYDAAHEL